MSDIIFRPFGLQKNILSSERRNIAAFSGKRCISPESRLLTKDGVKSIADISSSTILLSYDQRASQFVMSRSSASFPKTKCSGYRVIHEQGEFVASEDHLVFLKDHGYQSLKEIACSPQHYSTERAETFLCPALTTEEFTQILRRLVFDPGEVLSSKSYILAIEKVSTRWWWDIEVEGTNNYVSEGAIHHNSGKTEIGAIKSIVYQSNKPGWIDNHIDPYIGMIIAPTTDMLRRLSLKKFMAYAKPFIKRFNKSTFEIEWLDGSLIYGLSADRPRRIEGIKANWAWADEIFQMNEQTYLEIKARVSDSKGYIISTGSLGVNINNPKNHWAYRYYKEFPDEDTECYEWSTADNPHFPQDELLKLKDTLDPRTFKQMFTIDWNVPGSFLVYNEFDDSNLISNYIYRPELETYCSIDWGFAHEMAVLYFQYDRGRDIVYLFDEIVSSRMTLDKLWEKMQTRNYKITSYICDIAGNQEREQIGISNMNWFRGKNIHFKARRTAIQYGIPIVRSYIRNGAGQVKFYIDEKRCIRTIDQIKNYGYPHKDGNILNENPVKKDDDCCDALRYFFINILDQKLQQKAKISYYA